MSAGVAAIVAAASVTVIGVAAVRIRIAVCGTSGVAEFGSSSTDCFPIVVPPARVSAAMDSPRGAR